LSNGRTCTNCIGAAGLVCTAIVIANSNYWKTLIDSESSTIFSFKAVIVIQADTGFRIEKAAFTRATFTLGVFITGAAHGVKRHAIAIDVAIGPLGTCGSVEAS
jgi:hypothetical protein